MKNCEIVQYINRYCAHNNDLNTNTNADLAYAILAHGYLYVRPGDPTERFALNVIESLKVGATDGINMYLEYDYDCTPWPLEERVRSSMAKEALKIARASFNKRYFENQVAHLDPDEEGDESLLDKYLKLMDKERLLDFLYKVADCSMFYYAFSDVTVHDIKDELHERCRKMDSSLPEARYDYKRGVSLEDEDPYYMADYLSNEEIIDAIERSIVDNKSLAGHVARNFYYTNNLESMEPYINLIATYERAFRSDIYKPDICYECL